MGTEEKFPEVKHFEEVKREGPPRRQPQRRRPSPDTSQQSSEQHPEVRHFDEVRKELAEEVKTTEDPLISKTQTTQEQRPEPAPEETPQQKEEREQKEERNRAYKIITGKGEDAPDDFQTPEAAKDFFKLEKELVEEERKKQEAIKQHGPRSTEAEKAEWFYNNLHERYEKTLDELKYEMLLALRNEKKSRLLDYDLRAEERAKGKPLTEEEKKEVDEKLKKKLNAELKERGFHLVAPQINRLYEELENKRAAVRPEREKGLFQKLNEKYKNAPWYMKAAVGALTAAGVGGAIGLAMPILFGVVPGTMAYWGFGGYMGYRAMRGGLAATAASIVEPFRQGLMALVARDTEKVFAKKKTNVEARYFGPTGKIQKEMEQKMNALGLTDAMEWLEDRKKVSELMGFYDQQIQKYRRGLEKLARNKEWRSRWKGLAATLITGAAIGGATGALVDWYLAPRGLSWLDALQGKQEPSTQPFIPQPNPPSFAYPPVPDQHPPWPPQQPPIIQQPPTSPGGAIPTQPPAPSTPPFLGEGNYADQPSAPHQQPPITQQPPTSPGGGVPTEPPSPATPPQTPIPPPHPPVASTLESTAPVAVRITTPIDQSVIHTLEHQGLSGRDAFKAWDAFRHDVAAHPEQYQDFINSLKAKGFPIQEALDSGDHNQVTKVLDDAARRLGKNTFIEYDSSTGKMNLAQAEVLQAKPSGAGGGTPETLVQEKAQTSFPGEEGGGDTGIEGSSKKFTAVTSEEVERSYREFTQMDMLDAEEYFNDNRKALEQNLSPDEFQRYLMRIEDFKVAYNNYIYQNLATSRGELEESLFNDYDAIKDTSAFDFWKKMKAYLETLSETPRGENAERMTQVFDTQARPELPDLPHFGEYDANELERHKKLFALLAKKLSSAFGITEANIETKLNSKASIDMVLQKRFPMAR